MAKTIRQMEAKGPAGQKDLYFYLGLRELLQEPADAAGKKAARKQKPEPKLTAAEELDDLIRLLQQAVQEKPKKGPRTRKVSRKVAKK